MKRYCLACDLKDDEKMIAEYDAYHQQVWPGNIQSIKNAGITRMDIFRVSNRLFMIMDVNDDFSFEAKARADAEDATVKEWEQLMWNYQQAIPGATPGEKWVVMKQIFSLP